MYYGWFQIVFFEVPYMLLLLGSGMIYFILLHALQTKTNIIKSLTAELKLWILFAITTFLFGLFVAANHSYLISSVARFCEFLVLMFGIVYISSHDRNINFFSKIFILFSIICSIITIFWGIDFGQGRITMGLSNNPNSLGIIMAIGICLVLYEQDFKKLGYSIISFSVILLLFYVCLITGSRKSFISIVLIIIYWLAFVVFKDIKNLKLTDKVKVIFSIILVISALYFIFIPYFNDSLLLTRLTVLFESGSEGMVRENMYVEAFEIFKKSPFWGIGLDNYKAVSIFQTYSHSTYAEALACTGIIGCILYFSPYIMLLFNYKQILSSKIDYLLLKQAKIMLGLFGVLLFLGLGNIHFYDMTSSIAFGMLIGFYNINNKTINKTNNIY